VRRLWIIAAGAAAMALTLSTALALPPDPSGPDPAVRQWPQYDRVTSCGGLPFDPVVAFGGPTGSERGSGPVETALRNFLNRPGWGRLPKSHWRQVVAEERHAEFAHGRLGERLRWLAFELDGNAWEYARYSRCLPWPVDPVLTAASWHLAPERDQLRPSSRRLTLLSHGPGCTRTKPRLMDVGFQSSGRRLVITLWMGPSGLVVCRRKRRRIRSWSYRVELPGALGRRSLWDGATYPPIRRRLR
jgi:hypothetical protein